MCDSSYDRSFFFHLNPSNVWEILPQLSILLKQMTFVERRCCHQGDLLQQGRWAFDPRGSEEPSCCIRQLTYHSCESSVNFNLPEIFSFASLQLSKYSTVPIVRTDSTTDGLTLLYHITAEPGGWDWRQVLCNRFEQKDVTCLLISLYTNSPLAYFCDNKACAWIRLGAKTSSRRADGEGR